jgi:hypothetical protein
MILKVSQANQNSEWKKKVQRKYTVENFMETNRVTCSVLQYSTKLRGDFRFIP